MKKIVNQCKKIFIHLIIHFFSFVVNYFLFILLMLIFHKDNDIVTIQIINFLSWIISMLFIFYADKRYVHDLVDENNSKELFQFFLIRIIGLVLESLVLFVFVSVFKNQYFVVKLVSLIFLFITNAYYVKNIKFK